MKAANTLLVVEDDGAVVILAKGHRLILVGEKWMIVRTADNKLVREGMRSTLHLGVKALVSYEVG